MTARSETSTGDGKPVETATLDRLAAFFGEHLLRFVLAIPTGGLDDNLSDHQRSVAEQLGELVSDYQVEQASDKSDALLTALVKYNPDRGMSQACLLREYAGGDLPSVEGSGCPLESSLLYLARDYYPSILLPTASRYGGLLASPHAPMHDHPESRQFLIEALRDPDLSRLFPGAPPPTVDYDEAAKVSSYIIMSTGHGRGLPLAWLSAQILKNAGERAIVSGAVSMDDYFAATRLALDDMRRLARREPVEVPLAVALSNVELVAGSRIERGGVEIRPVADRDHLWVFPLERPSAVLFTNVPVKLLKVIPASADMRPSDEVEKFYGKFDEARTVRTQRITAALFSLLLASEGRPYYAAQPGLMRIFDPLYDVAVADSALALPPASEATAIGEDACRDVERWLGLMESTPSTLGVAVRRLLSAATVRHDPLDGLIDAVLAWENMFSGAPETTLRVCGALALLLEPDSFAKRKELFADLKKIYEARSRVVHGAVKVPEFDQAVRMRDRAVDVGLEAIRRLYAFPELLSLDAGARGADVLLGHALPQCGEHSGCIVEAS